MRAGACRTGSSLVPAGALPLVAFRDRGGLVLVLSPERFGKRSVSPVEGNGSCRTPKKERLREKPVGFECRPSQAAVAFAWLGLAASRFFALSDFRVKADFVTLAAMADHAISIAGRNVAALRVKAG